MQGPTAGRDERIDYPHPVTNQLVHSQRITPKSTAKPLPGVGAFLSERASGHTAGLVCFNDREQREQPDHVVKLNRQVQPGEWPGTFLSAWRSNSPVWTGMLAAPAGSNPAALNLLMVITAATAAMSQP